MAPKKKQTKNVEGIGLVKAFEATYKAACRLYRTAPSDIILGKLEELAEEGKPLDKLILAGLQWDGPGVQALVDCCAGYPHVRNLCCWGTRIGDMGLLAITRLLRASTAPLYKGSTLKMLEITYQGQSTDIGTKLLLLSPHDVTGHLMGDEMVVSAVPRLELPPDFSHEALGTTQRTGPDWHPSSRPSTSGRPFSAASAGSTSASSRGAARLFSGRRFLTDSYEAGLAPSRPQTAQANHRFDDGISIVGEDGGVLTFDGAGSDEGGADGPLAGASPFRAAEQPPQCPFGQPALLEFSSALASQGLALKVLTLDNTYLGDAAAEILFRGVRCCTSLKELSLAYCGLSARGTAALADALLPDVLHGRVVGQPAMEVLNLKGNKIGPFGLQVVAGVVAGVESLRYIGVADIGVDEGHLPVLQLFGEACASNLTLTGIDLDQNYIGNSGALIFKRLLEVRGNISRLKLINRISRQLAMEIAALLAFNFPKKGKKGKGKKK